mgnify:FL=1
MVSAGNSVLNTIMTGFGCVSVHLVCRNHADVATYTLYRLLWVGVGMESTTIPKDEIASLIINLKAILKWLRILVLFCAAIPRSTSLVAPNGVFSMDKVRISYDDKSSFIWAIIRQANQSLVAPKSVP